MHVAADAQFRRAVSENGAILPESACGPGSCYGLLGICDF